MTWPLISSRGTVPSLLVPYFLHPSLITRKVLDISLSSYIAIFPSGPSRLQLSCLGRGSMLECREGVEA